MIFLLKLKGTSAPHPVLPLLAAAVLTMALLLSGCAARQVPVTSGNGVIVDVERFPQNFRSYIPSGKENTRLLPAARQADMNARFDKLFFGPWHATRAAVTPAVAFELFGGAKANSKARGWAENLLPWTQSHWDGLVANLNRNQFPSRLDRGITVQATEVRGAPTGRPYFGNPERPGRGFPFDMFMYSALPAGMPLLMVHTSADGEWVFAETALVSGWIRARDVASVDAAFCGRYESGKYAAIVRDGTPVRDTAGNFLCMGNVGTVFPLLSMNSSTAEVLAPARDSQGRAVLTRAHVPSTEIVSKPAPLTPGILADIGNSLLGQPYGWGGLFGDRDCSLSLRDLFVPFGIWLPRNSAAQSKAGNFVSFSGQGGSSKRAQLAEQGVPFATLLYLPGHIALYLGEHNGEAVMFHNMWGIRTDAGGKEGRFVVGRAVITGLQPGVERSDVKNKEGLLGRMKGFTLL